MLKYFVFLLFFSPLLSLSEKPLWQITPTEVVDEFNAYPAILLNHQGNRLQLSISDENSKITLWTTTEEELHLPFGTKLTILVHRLNRSLSALLINNEKIPCQLETMPLDMTSFEVPDNVVPLIEDPFYIFGQPYIAYATNNKIECIKGERTKHWYEIGDCDYFFYRQMINLNLVVSVGDPQQVILHKVWREEEISDRTDLGLSESLKMVRNWKESDEVILFVHQYYPGFRWLVNQTRNSKSIFFSGNAIEKIDQNLWAHQ